MDNNAFSNEQVLNHVIKNTIYVGAIRKGRPTFLLNDYDLREYMRMKIENILPIGWKAIHDRVSDGYNEHDCVSIIEVNIKSDDPVSTKIFALENALNILHLNTPFGGFIMDGFIEVPFGAIGPNEKSYNMIRSIFPPSWNIKIGANSANTEWKSIIISSSQFE